MHPKHLSINDYAYHLPEDKIARYPLEQRDASKVLVYKAGVVTQTIFRNIDKHIPGKSLLIFNNTKVIEARILFQKPTGGIVEIFCLEPGEQYPDITTAMSRQGNVLWQCLVGGASKWKKGQILEKIIKNGDEETILNGTYKEKRAGYFIIELSWSPRHLSFAELLHQAGAVPLPPYIKREAERGDAERYQTIYARHNGSVAAPTAGLHFTAAVFQELKEKNIITDFVTLHVGAGTFKPVKTQMMGDHEMHAEFIDVSKNTIDNILQNIGNTVVAVGTTSLRTLESLYWLGVKTATLDPPPTARELSLSQWEVYDQLPQDLPVTVALQSLLDWMEKNQMERLLTKTQLLIAPGYTMKIARALITNFHQPNSTLLLLVAALIGDDWKTVYDYALQHDFRFLSYGDSTLLWLPVS